MNKKIILAPFLFIISIFAFTILDHGFGIKNIDEVIQPILFSLGFVIAVLLSPYRKYLFVTSMILLSLMVLTYLLQMMEISNWLGSLGFGMLVITFFSYIPEIVKKGFIEKF